LCGFNPHALGNLRIVGQHEVREHECFDASGLCDSTGILCRRLMGKNTCLQRRGIRYAAHQTVDGCRVHHRVDQDVGALR
jgi:hypothetical protein